MRAPRQAPPRRQTDLSLARRSEPIAQGGAQILASLRAARSMQRSSRTAGAPRRVARDDALPRLCRENQ
eukprot:7995672-Pyramimonas_sp.AAC.1